MSESIDIDKISAALQDALEDVHTRFILNLPESEFQSADRILFQVEQAWWYYDDFICDKNPQVDLPRFTTFKPFAKLMFDYSVLLKAKDFNDMWNQFSTYKRGIANYGCILLNLDCTKLILCKVWNGNTFMLPGGKINQGEDGGDAAARETYEETGFDPTCSSGLTAQWYESNPSLITWNREMLDSHLLVSEDRGGKQRNCYIVMGVPEDFPFSPVARKEVASVEWHPIDHLPKPNFAVIPFIVPLKKWLRKNNRKQSKPRKRTPKGGKVMMRDNTPAKAQRNVLVPKNMEDTGNKTILKPPSKADIIQDRCKETCSTPMDDSGSDLTDEQFVMQWLANLPRPHATKHFGTFRLDANAIWNKAMMDVTMKQQTSQQ